MSILTSQISQRGRYLTPNTPETSQNSPVVTITTKFAEKMIPLTNDTGSLDFILHEEDLSYRQFEGDFPVKLDHFTTVSTMLKNFEILVLIVIYLIFLRWREPLRLNSTIILATMEPLHLTNFPQKFRHLI